MPTTRLPQNPGIAWPVDRASVLHSSLQLLCLWWHAYDELRERIEIEPLDASSYILGHPQALAEDLQVLATNLAAYKGGKDRRGHACVVLEHDFPVVFFEYEEVVDDVAQLGRQVSGIEDLLSWKRDRTSW